MCVCVCVSVIVGSCLETAKYHKWFLSIFKWFVLLVDEMFV